MVNRLFTGVLGFVIGVMCVTATTAQSNRRYVNGRSAANPEQAAQPPFSGAVVVGDTAYLSGVLGSGETADAAATSGLNAFKNALTASGMTMDDIVQIQVFCPDITMYADFNKVYRTFFTKEFPARAFLGSGPLLNNAKFEIIGIAVKR